VSACLGFCKQEWLMCGSWLLAACAWLGLCDLLSASSVLAGLRKTLEHQILVTGSTVNGSAATTSKCMHFSTGAWQTAQLAGLCQLLYLQCLWAGLCQPVCLCASLVSLLSFSALFC
jgi:hypothetical protein